MSLLSELRDLKRQERALVNLASKISDQLNRLKVEELALVSNIRMQQGKEMEVQELADTDLIKEDLDVDEDFTVSVDLSIPGPSQSQGEEIEEEDEDDEEHDDLTSFITELSHRDDK